MANLCDETFEAAWINRIGWWPSCLLAGFDVEVESPGNSVGSAHSARCAQLCALLFDAFFIYTRKPVIASCMPSVPMLCLQANC